MIKAILIGAAACSGAIADELYSTFGEERDYSGAIPLVGQTMVVPNSCTELMSFNFVASTATDEVPYIVAVYHWSEADQHVVGNALFADSGVLVPGDAAMQFHEMGVNLTEGETIAVIVGYFPDGDVDFATGYTLTDIHENGSFIGTFGPSDHEWDLPEADKWDLVFAAKWDVCKGDMYPDGNLTILDFLAFDQAFKEGLPEADFNDDGVLNVLDFVAFQAAFQMCVGA
jgi:hypothetical protein